MNTSEKSAPPASRDWNWRIWAGFLLAIVALVSYFLLFVRFPITRNVPWANWLLFALAAWLFWGGLRRGLGSPETHRGKIAGPIAAFLSLALAALFAFFTLFASKGLPASASAPRIGAHAPEFVLADTTGKMVALSTLLSEPLPGMQGAKPRGVVLIFYRGYW